MKPMSALDLHRTAAVSLARRALLSAAALFAAGRAWSGEAATAGTAGKEGFLVLPGQAPRFAGPQGREQDFTELLATREQTGGALGLFRQAIAPGSGPPTHLHRAEEEFFYVVSGEFRFRLGDRIVDAPAQSVVFVPRGTAHTFQNVGTEPGVLFEGVTPGGLEMMFAEWQGVDAETSHTMMERHNVVVVGPPLR
jgi:mannose-6-phosphate isomerase-like protein (cupin superfamily)